MSRAVVTAHRPKRDDGDLYCHENFLSPTELQVTFDAMRAGGFSTIDGFVRVAMWKLAKHLLTDLPPDVFQLTSRFR